MELYEMEMIDESIYRYVEQEIKECIEDSPYYDSEIQISGYDDESESVLVALSYSSAKSGTYRINISSIENCGDDYIRAVYLMENDLDKFFRCSPWGD